jgi:hypothetical protein
METTTPEVAVARLDTAPGDGRRKPPSTHSATATGASDADCRFSTWHSSASDQFDMSFAVEAQSCHLFFELALVAVTPQKSFQH